MAKRTDPGADQIYAAARAWLGAAWRQDDSLFTPGQSNWTTDHLAEFRAALVDNPDTGEGTFQEKLHGQLEGKPPSTIQLAAELLYAHLLLPSNIGGETKRRQVKEVLSWMDAPPSIPPDLSDALDHGLVNPGQYYLNRRDLQVGYLLDAALAWRRLDPAERDSLLSDPWGFRDFAWDISNERGVGAQRNALLHLLHPDLFDAVVSDDHKRQIIAGFEQHVTDPTANLDRQLAEIRDQVSPEFGDGFEWYQPRVRPRWDSDADAWTVFIEWAKSLAELPDFDQLERDDKLEAAAVMSDALTAWRGRDTDWPALIRRAFQTKTNDLTSWQSHDKFSVWMGENPDDASEALSVLLDSDDPPADRVGRFLDVVPSSRPSGVGNRVSVASYLLMATAPTELPVYRAKPFKSAWRLTKYTSASSSLTARQLYMRAIAFCDQFISESADRGLDVRDRLDAQGLIWAITRGDPPAAWPPDKQEALREYRGDDVTEDDDGSEPDIPSDETERRKARYLQMRDAWENDTEAQDRLATLQSDNERGSAELPNLVAGLRASRDLDPFIESLNQYVSVGERPPVRNFLARLRNEAEKAPGGRESTAERFAASAALPVDDDAALASLSDLGSLVEDIGPAGPFSPGTAGLVLTTLWGLVEPQRYPVLYEYAEGVAKDLAWFGAEKNRHLRYWQLMRELDDSPWEAARVLSWARSHFSGLDTSLIQRSRENAASAHDYVENGGAYTDDTEAQDAEHNAQCLAGEMRLVGRVLKQRIEKALGRKVRFIPPSLRNSPDSAFRHDSFGGWAITDVTPKVDLRVWTTVEGIGVGLWPRWSGKDQINAAAEAFAGPAPDGFRYYQWTSDDGRFNDVGETAPDSGFLFGRWFGQEALGRASFGDEIVAIADAARPLLGSLSTEVPDSAVDADASPDGVDHLAQVAEELYIDREHVDRIVDLLQLKGQVILYGPPGTGKTFLAQKLAAALTGGDHDRWRLVQFHPSTSYEDFFEGYRPTVDEGTGQLSYELRKGPLADIAERATAHPDDQHLLLIDEINRANIPKVFGELLYLLEYRDEPIRSLYRPDQDFRLPKNLWIIGTMNTADRSIGLIDAAMRRRFHFVPFFPDREPIIGVLERWLEDNQSQAIWVSKLVDLVNEELAESLSRHLQIGPSFFMREALDEATVEQIWNHSIHPFLEDQFFGDQAKIDDFEWVAVLKRYRQSREPASDGTGEFGPGVP